MTTDLLLRGKWTLRSGGRSLVLKKRSNEKGSHVLMKAFLWALYLPEYPGVTVEVRIGDRYKPDVVELDEAGAPTFWGECGQVGRRKLESLFRRFPKTHFAVAKWDDGLRQHAVAIEQALGGRKRQAPIDLVLFPEDSAERFIDDEGEISLGFDDLIWRRIAEGR